MIVATALLRAQDLGPYPDWETSEYVLPYPVGEAYNVWQGNGYGGHLVNLDGTFIHSYDFKMEIGTPITAARAGRVRWYHEHYEDDATGGFDDGNWVLIEHDDGTYASYSHLTLNGVVPLLFEEIEQGQLIGYSGNSGHTGGVPHLHFHVTACPDGNLPCPEHDPDTLPVTFRNTTPNPSGLQTGVTYRAEAYAAEPVEPEPEPQPEPVVEDPLEDDVPVLEATPVAPLLALSTRSIVVEGEVVHAGFVVGGAIERTVLIRGIGPGLAALGVTGTMPDPRLTIMHKGEVVAQADNWNGALADLFAAIGAFALPDGSRDAAIVLQLSPGVYTALLGNTDAEVGGDALVEVYLLE